MFSFPWRILRPNPPFLKGSLPSNIKDPWARRDTWRYHSIFDIRNQTRLAFPGLGLGSAAFAVYCAVEYLLGSGDDHHGHGHGHGEEKKEGHH